MRFLYDLLHTYNVSFPPGGETQELSLFEQGKAAMILGGTWNGYHVSENAPGLEYVMTSLPPGPGCTKRATVTWANMMMMPANCAHPQETWEYLRYYGGLRASIDMLEILSRNSARLDLYDTPQWKAQVEAHPYLKMVPEIAASGVMYPYKRFEEINDAFKPYYQMAILGTMPVEEAMKEGNARAERILEGNWADRLLETTKAGGASPEAGQMTGRTWREWLTGVGVCRPAPAVILLFSLGAIAVQLLGEPPQLGHPDTGRTPTSASTTSATSSSTRTRYSG